MHFAVTAAFLLPPEKALKKTPTLLGAYFLTPARVSSSNCPMAGEFGALPAVPLGRLAFNVVGFPIVASHAGLLRPARTLYSEDVQAGGKV